MNRPSILPLLALLALGACQGHDPAGAPAYPQTRQGTAADTFFGIRVPDPYRWLENDTAEETHAWVKAENEVTDAYMTRIPFLDKIREELRTQMNYARMTAPSRHGDYSYVYRNTGLQNQSVLWRMRDPADTASAEVFLDPNTFAEGGRVSLQGTSFTRDGSLMAYLLSMGGSDWREVVVLDTRTGKPVGDTLHHLKFSGVAWKGNEGFYYSTYEVPEGASRLTYKTTRHTLYYHRLGTPQSEDRFVFGGDRQPHRYIGAYLTEDQHYLVITAAETTTGNELYIQDLTQPGAPVQPVVTGYSSEQYVADNVGSTLYIHTNRDAPHYRLVRVDAAHPGPEHWKDVIPEAPQVLDLSSGGGYFFARYMDDVKDRVYQYDYQGRRIREVSLPAAGSARGFDALRGDTVLYYTFTSFTYPSTVYRYSIADGRSTLYWKPDLDFNPDDFVTEQVFYRSKDSTRVPMYIVYRKGLKRDGSNPTYLYGYGGFNISLMPSFSSTRMVWLKHGGIYAQPNLRGGGEYGEAWHLAGTRMQKQHVFDDFIAAAEYLIRERYTSSSRLAIAGGSNGGLLVGATMTQRPDLMRVALPSIGVLDMLRYHRFTAGAGWASDYGTAEDSLAMFRYLLGYSPLQNVRAGTAYPATLIWTADHDDRVVPGHSFKFAAVLQAATAGPEPVLIRIQTNAGHGTGMDLERVIDQQAEAYGFAWHAMGVNPWP